MDTLFELMIRKLTDYFQGGVLDLMTAEFEYFRAY